jgi:hypothetical protein
MLALTVALALVGPASAAVLVKQSGLWGDYGTYDSSVQPGAKCGYSAADGTGTAYLRWIKVNPPKAAARDITSARDHQQVSWQVTIQRDPGTGHWKNVAHSGVQTKTTYDDLSATYGSLKVYVNGAPGQIFRAIITLKWLRNGSVEGFVKLRIEYYSVKWTVGIPTYVFTDACTGSAD